MSVFCYKKWQSHFPPVILDPDPKEKYIYSGLNLSFLKYGRIVYGDFIIALLIRRFADNICLTLPNVNFP